MCLFFTHDFYPIKVHHYYDVSYGYNVPSSRVVWKCKKCYKLKEKSFYGVGFLTLEEVIGAKNGVLDQKDIS